MMNKNNVPYLIAGALATATLLASEVFAAAPYIGFLAPVAALSVGLTFIIGYAVFSVVTIALSYKAISENKTNSELKNKMKAQEQTISGQKTQLAKKEAEVKAQEEENSKLKNKVEAQEEENSKLKDQVRTQKQKNSEQKTQLAEKNKKIEEDKLKVAIADGTVQLAKGTVNSAVWFAKEAVNGVLYSGKYAYDNYVPSTESTKGTLSGIGGGLKNTYDASIASVRGALNSVGSSLYSRIYGTKVSSPEEQFKREDGSKPSMQELTRLDYLNLEVLSSEQKQRANSLDYLNIDNVPKQPDHLNVDAAKSDLMSLSEDQDVFYDAESGDEKDTEVSSLKEQLDENNKTKIQSRISVVYELVKGKFTSFWSGVQNSYVLGTNLLHAQHKNTLANVPQEEVINKEAQKPEEQAEQKPNLQRDNSINNTKEDGKNKRSGAARRKRKQARVEQPIVYAVKISNKYDGIRSGERQNKVDKAR